MNEDIRKRVEIALDKESDGNGYCRYCGAEDYPVDETGNKILGEDLTDAVEYHFDHADTCPSVLMSALLHDNARLQAERAQANAEREALRGVLQSALGYAQPALEQAAKEEHPPIASAHHLAILALTYIRMEATKALTGRDLFAEALAELFPARQHAASAAETEDGESGMGS